MPLTFFSVVYLIGAAIAYLLITSLVYNKQYHGTAQKLLLGLLLCIGTILLQQGLIALESLGIMRYVYWLILGTWFGISPLLFLYIRAVLNRDFQLRPKHLLHFIFPLYIMLEWICGWLDIPFHLHLLFKDQQFFFNLWILLFLSIGIAYTSLSLKDLKEADLPAKQRSQLGWLRWFLIGFLVTLIISVVLILFFMTAKQYSNTFEFILILCYEIFVLAIVLKMLNTSTYFRNMEHQEYASSKLNGQALEELQQQLDAFMRSEKPYLDKKLNLASLSQQSKIPAHQLSQIFSQYHGSNFYDFINTYRLDDLTLILFDPNYQHYTITGMAEVCGFNSKAVFYKSFKNRFGMTPSQYITQKKLT